MKSKIIWISIIIVCVVLAIVVIVLDATGIHEVEFEWWSDIIKPTLIEIAVSIPILLLLFKIFK